MRKIDLTSFQLASSETARQINRRIALNFIRRHEPLSRADLARHSGLQRSTVSAIVDQLIEEGWVVEGAVGHALRGRRPRFLHLNVEKTGILAVDFRPETTTVGLAGVDARFLVKTSWPTPKDPPAFVAQLKRTVTSFRRAHPQMRVEGMGVGLPGRADRAGRLVFAPNLGWGEVDLRRMLESAMGVPVVLENDANVCALAELWFGRHPEHVRHLLAVAISEGVGVGLLLNGQLVHGGDSRAGEFGHVCIDETGPICGCGRRGCWERYASDSAAEQYYAMRVARRRRTIAAASGTAGGGAGGKSGQRLAPALRFNELLRLAAKHDRLAGETIDRTARFLGIGLAGLITGLAPEIIVVVGEVTTAWDRVGPIIAEVVAQRALPHALARIVPADRSAVLRGAVALVVQEHFGAPSVA
jgi:predicted NBD/HSP70 family sugar kinase